MHLHTHSHITQTKHTHTHTHTADKAMVMAKESLFETIDIQELKKRGPSNKIESLRVELYEKINRLGIGAQGLGG